MKKIWIKKCPNVDKAESKKQYLIKIRANQHKGTKETAWVEEKVEQIGDQHGIFIHSLCPDPAIHHLSLSIFIHSAQHNNHSVIIHHQEHIFLSIFASSCNLWSQVASCIFHFGKHLSFKHKTINKFQRSFYFYICAISIFTSCIWIFCDSSCSCLYIQVLFLLMSI